MNIAANTDPSWFINLQQYGSSTVSSVSGVVYKPSLWVNTTSTTNTAGTSWPLVGNNTHEIGGFSNMVYNALKLCCEKGERPNSITEATFCNAPVIALSYSSAVLRRRFILAESVILSSPVKETYTKLHG